MDYSRLKSDPCSAISADQLPALGFSAATKSHPDPNSALGADCGWDDDTASTAGISMGVSVQKDLPNGLADIYSQRRGMAYFVEVDISGYPGVLASRGDDRAQDCVLDLGVSNSQALLIEYQDFGRSSNPCQRVQAIGRAVIATLKGA